MANPTFDRDAVLMELLDRQHISDVMLRFGRALDLHDWDMYAATLADPFEVDFFDLTGKPPAMTTPAKWARLARANLERLIVMHQYSNFHITVRRRQRRRHFLSCVASSATQSARRRPVHPIRVVRKLIPADPGGVENHPPEAHVPMV